MNLELQVGDKGYDVYLVQVALNAAGFTCGAPDGEFGPITQVAVIDFQKAKDLKPGDGIVDFATLANLASTTNKQVAAVTGVDVSGYDPNVDWTRVMGAGTSFAFIKATEGVSYVNPFFHRDWQASAESRVMRGAYHFFRPEDDGVSQAQHMVKTIGANLLGALPPVLDWEVGDSVSAEDQKADALDFCRTIKSETGTDAIIYMDPGFAEKLGNLSDFSSNLLWIANLDKGLPTVPPAWKEWTFWQHTFTGAVPGINGAVDQNWFRGGIEELKALLIR